MNLVDYKKNGLAPRRIDFFSEFNKDLDHVFNEVFGAPFNRKKSKGYPLIDAIREGEKLIFHCTVPGVKSEDLSVEVGKDEHGKLLIISGKLSSDYVSSETSYQIRELSSQEFRRVVGLPEDVTEDEPQAVLRDGVLKLTFSTKKQKELESSTKKIKIKEI